MELLANGKDISKFEDKAVLHARQYLVYQILHDKLGTSNIRLPSLALMLDRQIGGCKRMTVKDTKMKKSTRLTDNTCTRNGRSRDEVAESNTIAWGEYDTEQYDVMTALESL
jgi:hypothetical protein